MEVEVKVNVGHEWKRKLWELTSVDGDGIHRQPRHWRHSARHQAYMLHPVTTSRTLPSHPTTCSRGPMTDLRYQRPPWEVAATQEASPVVGRRGHVGWANGAKARVVSDQAEGEGK